MTINVQNISDIPTITTDLVGIKGTLDLCPLLGLPVNVGTNITSGEGLAISNGFVTSYGSFEVEKLGKIELHNTRIIIFGEDIQYKDYEQAVIHYVLPYISSRNQATDIIRFLLIQKCFKVVREFLSREYFTKDDLWQFINQRRFAELYLEEVVLKP